MIIWAFNSPSKNALEFINKSLKQGISRFGWAYIDTADIRTLENKPWKEMTEDEIIIWKKAGFLSNIKKGDWIVHINVPEWGMVTAGKVIQEYNFDKNNQLNDFRHFFELDINSIISFNRNDPNVHPLISRKLKLRGRYWRIAHEKEFLQSIHNIKNKTIAIHDNSTIGLHYLKKELVPIYNQITKIIHNTHPEKKLEYFIADIFKATPNVLEVKVNGSGWGTDYGADVIVKYSSGINILDLNNESTLVIQVKSYEGNHWSSKAVQQIKTAINTFNADAGIIITTAKSTDKIEKEIDEASILLDTPISLVAGENVAKFVLKYGRDLLFEI